MINLYVYDPIYLQILFPECHIKESGSHIPPNTIYTGKNRVVGDSGAYWVVHTPSMAEVKITNREELVTFAYQRKGKKCPISVMKRVLSISSEELIGELKLFFALGQWKRLTKTNVKIYHLFNYLCDSKSKFLNSYFTLRDELSFPVLFSSILTFFMRVINFDDKTSTLSVFYKDLILRFKSNSKNLKSVSNLMLSNHFDEVSVINFILNVRG